MKMTTLSSFPANRKFHTGFYSKEAYLEFKRLFKRIRDFRYYVDFWIFQNAMSEVIICSKFDSYAKHYWKTSLGIDWNESLTFQECLKLTIAKYANCDTFYGCEIKSWAEGKDPVDVEKFKKLVGVPNDPITVEMYNLVAEEEQKIIKKFNEFRDEVYERSFCSADVLFKAVLSSVKGNLGYEQNLSSEKYLSSENAEKLYSAEKDAHDALCALMKAADVYKTTQQKWNSVNKEIRHLLIVEKKKEIGELKKNLKAMMKV